MMDRLAVRQLAEAVRLLGKANVKWNEVMQRR